MEQVLQLINAKYVSLDEEEVQYSNELLKTTIKDLLIPAMQDNDELFKEIYNTLSYGGSYYDRLKVGRPDEFDLDIKLLIPPCKDHNQNKCKRCVEIISCKDAPGFIYFKVKETCSKEFNEFIEDGYMQNNRVIKTWFKRIVTIALTHIEDDIKEEAQLQSLEVIEKKHEDEEQTGRLKYGSESGPALTLHAKGKFGQVDIDLVPAFEFDVDNWPDGFRRYTSKEKNEFLVVPKKLTNEDKHCERYWRASFQVQEKELIHDKQWLKPALKLLKKMRTSHHTSIPSYALKTIALWDLELEFFDYEGETLSDSFLHLAECYKRRLAEQNISYYWKKDNNLFDMKHIHSDTLTNYHNHISKILDDLAAEPDNPYIIAKLILKDGTEEYEEIISEMKENDDKYHISDYTSYSNLDPYLQSIFTKNLTLGKNKLKIIKSFVQDDLLPLMRSKDPIFEKMCSQKMFFYNSYFTGLGHSLCLGLSLPKCETCNKKYCPCVTLIQGDPFLFLKVERHFCESWNEFAEKKMLLGDFVLSWLHCLIQDSLKYLPLPDDIGSCKVEYLDNGGMSYSDQDQNNRPRLTLIVGGNSGILHINIVPAFIFNYDFLPDTFRVKPRDRKNNIFVMPVQNGSFDKRQWWPCFYDQERKLLKGKQMLNPVLRLLKKVRDSHGHRLVSDYALRSVFLWDVELNKCNYNKSLGDTFMYAIQKYTEHLKTKKIRWYWKKRFNLLNSESTKLNDYYQDIKNKISQFKNDCVEHPEFVVKFILGNGTNENNALKRVKIENVQQAQIIREYYFFKDQDSDSDNEDQDSDSDDEDQDSDSDDEDQDSDSDDDDAPSLFNRRPNQDGIGGGSSSFGRPVTGFHNDYSNYATPDTVRSRNHHLLDQRNVDNREDGWITAAAVIGCVAVVGLGMLGAVALARRNNNRRK